MNKKSCNGCTACCFLLDIPELKKPIKTNCIHCKVDGGCSIYNIRPIACQNFQCMWLKNENWEYELKPDISNVMFEELQTTDTILVHSIKYNAWMQEKNIQKIQHIVSVENKSIIIIDLKDGGGFDKHMILSKDKTPEDIWNELIHEFEVIYGGTYNNN